MKITKKSSLVTAALALPFLSATSALGATSFSASLTSLPSELNVSSSASAREVTFGSGGAFFARPGDGSRNYLRTNDTDYGSISFTAFVTVTTTLGGNFNANSQFFFGLGTGAVGEFGVPDRDTNASISFSLNSGVTGENFRIFSTSTGDTNENELADGTYNGTAPARTNSPTLNPSTATTTAIRLVFDTATDSVTYALDYEYAGDSTYSTFTVDQSLSATIPAGTLASSDGAAASSIFFGGDSAANDVNTARDFQVTVIPEPSSSLLCGFAGIALAARRRRN